MLNRKKHLIFQIANKKLLPTMYKNNRSILGLTKGRCKFTTSDFPAENPRIQTRNYSYTQRWQTLKTN